MAKCEYCVYTFFPLHFSPDPFSSPFRQPPPPHRGGDLARLRQARPLRRHHRLLQGPHRPSSQLSVNAGRGSSLSFYLSFSVSDVRHAFSRYCCCVKDKENGELGRCLETDLGEKVKDGRAMRTRPGLSRLLLQPTIISPPPLSSARASIAAPFLSLVSLRLGIPKSSLLAPHLSLAQAAFSAMSTATPINVDDDELDTAGENQLINEVRSLVLSSLMAWLSMNIVEGMGGRARWQGRGHAS